MVRVQASSPFCIDSTEVTQAQYQVFLDATAGIVSQPSACAWNLSLAPTPSCFDPVKKPNVPVVCVDWCDARAYCAWAGKRLCGALGGGAGGGKPLEKLEWYMACSKNATRVYAYGATYEQGICNDASSGKNALVDVASNPKCVGGFDGVFDMSGNATEWVDVCDDDSPNSSCQARGGTFDEKDPAVDPTRDLAFAHLRCNSGDQFHPPRGSSGESLGFRCCSDVFE
ncbi:Sulfatase modifying factor 2 precursor (C-alpha-formyglycine- generating enzyme 2) [Labilithrix luteola]|uniref:Sulfatase modifying factor 2 (C-alpha-formyglycine-generating enzyme 2) n=2 Tax=Labilithrix luteola TaxID=1391654 RepID=A0A0K1PV88_9BACT|nr:Sulfatase modifying factor 2 precursor (C-alpha-formyglycine- generating enzyme 2) [Labilithrix luteola]